MGLVYANIGLVNEADMQKSDLGLIGEDEIRQIEVRCLVDSGAVMLSIGQDLCDYLGLKIKGKKIAHLANGQRVELPYAGTVEVRFGDRTASTNALILPGDSEPLLGAIPMEEMDLIIHPSRGELIPAHADGPLTVLKGMPRRHK
jgi:hypothetical protein